MPAAIPLRIRIPVEYGVTMAIGLAVAWLYSTYAGAAFFAALGIGLAMVLGFWLIMQVYPKTRGKSFHFLTAAALAATLLVVLQWA